MSFTVKSTASSDLVMFDAIAALRTAIAADKARQVGQAADENEPESGVDRKVSLWQRALPLLDLFERSLQENEPVTWGG